ncbi:DNA gyrase subunit A [Zavarzinia sp. CC-PAN008]|uniref:DNA gyrase subunit A n=1 Tax=Zavarzinia sp. CC-PAN008 TaxID=3243332 RepID=UPI003F748EAB
MRRSYLDYAMSVIVSRALPDVRDGLKPVHRRILFGMQAAGFDWNKATKKSARATGEVMGKYHPHGNQAIYDAMVRLVQDFSMSLPLLDGQGNFGSMDGDSPAAERYTEIRLARAADFLLQDIDEDTVDFQPTYDNANEEPTVLPARFPNLLVNGGGGIAVGMATNIPPHNLGEVIDACIAMINDADVSTDDLMQIVKGPDFPTGAQILGQGAIRQAYLTGRGSVIIRGKHHIEQLRGDREAIIVTEIPYQVNKAGMVERIAEQVKLKKIEGIAADGLRDESNREGVRVVIELKRDANADVVLNQIYRFSPLQSSFAMNMMAIRDGRPELLDLRTILRAFLDFREQVISRRTRFRLNKARDRAHVLAGLLIAVANIDKVIAIIRGSADPAAAREALMAEPFAFDEVIDYLQLIEDVPLLERTGHYRLSEEQARAILDLRLQRLTGLGREEIGQELRTLETSISDYLLILRSRPRLLELMRDELLEVRALFAVPRRTEILENVGDLDDEDLIQREDMVVTVSRAGYIKRVPLSAYRAQRRGGRGRTAMSTRDEDFVTQVFAASTHTPILFFSDKGMAYQLKVYRLPVGTPQARGKAMVNLLPLSTGERITTVMPLPEGEVGDDHYAMFATAKGNVRRNQLSEFVDVRSSGKIAMKFEGEDADDRLIAVAPCSADQDVLIASANGQAVRFPVTGVRVFASRGSTGVRGIRLLDGDSVVAMCILGHAAGDPTDDEDAPEAEEPALAEVETEEREGVQYVLTVTANGYGKRTAIDQYRLTNRGGKGIINIQTTKRNGPVVAALPVEAGDQLILLTDAGQAIRTRVDEIRIAGRNTQGVVLLRTADGEKVVSVTRVGDDASADDPSPDDPAGAEEEAGDASAPGQEQSGPASGLPDNEGDASS